MLMPDQLGHFGIAPQYWLNLQATHDLKRTRAEMPREALHIEPYAVT